MSHVQQRPIELRQLGTDTPPELIAVLARAFYFDPVFGFFAKDQLHEYRLLASIFEAFTADTNAFDTTWVATAGHQMVGAAVWLPPEGMPRSKRREAALNLRALRILARARNKAAGFKLLDAMDKHHPHEPHWYLMLLGTDPIVQRRGVGSRLLKAGMDRADADGLPCYLETQKEENLAFYGPHGFEVQQVIDLPATPKVWTMQRAPKAR